MFATLALTLLAPMAGASDPIEPMDVAVVEAFLTTEGATSSCDAYQTAGTVAEITGDPSLGVMMQDMAEAYLVIQFETIWSDTMGGTQRMTDEARDTYHAYLVTC